LVSYGAGLWNVYLSDIWPEFIWNIRSFDPDIIDLRWAGGKDLLKRTLGNAPWRVICSDENLPPRGAAVDSWRTYDPDQKVSIVLPVYNGEDYLRQSIESCLAQTHRNIELVIVDDCSQDNSPSIVSEYARRDPRVISIRNTRNKRLPGALNVGFAATTGQLLTWTSHDNFYAPDAIEALVSYLCTWRDVDLVYSAFRFIDASGSIEPSVNYLRPPWRLPIENVVGAYFLYRRRVYETVGNYREDMEYVEDYEYWVRVYKRGFKLMRLHHPMYYYRSHSDSMTSRAEKMAERPHAGDKVRREHFKCGAL
jgi:glycosyltransferase involved in cell wall biosynthesis